MTRHAYWHTLHITMLDLYFGEVKNVQLWSSLHWLVAFSPDSLNILKVLWAEDGEIPHDCALRSAVFKQLQTQFLQSCKPLPTFAGEGQRKEQLNFKYIVFAPLSFEWICKR